MRRRHTSRRYCTNNNEKEGIIIRLNPIRQNKSFGDTEKL